MLLLKNNMDNDSIFFSFVKFFYMDDFKTFFLNKKFDFNHISNIINEIDTLFSKVRLEPNRKIDLTHEVFKNILRDVEDIEYGDDEFTNDYNKNHQLIPFIELLALYIELFSPYFIEVSSIILEGEDRFYQIDEQNTKFYISIFNDSLELAWNNFDNSKIIKFDEIKTDKLKTVLDELQFPENFYKYIFESYDIYSKFYLV